MKEVFPRLFQAARDKKARIVDYYLVEEEVTRWVIDFRRNQGTLSLKV